jgi:hypothetical protein
MSTGGLVSAKSGAFELVRLGVKSLISSYLASGSLPSFLHSKADLVDENRTE